MDALEARVRDDVETIDDIMARVAADIAKVGVGKSGQFIDRDGRKIYKFRPLDEVLNTVGPIMARHSLAMTVTFMDRIAERIPTKSGGSMVSVVLTGVFTYRWRREERKTITIGEAMDTADKATNKAMAMATKYAHVLTFNIPVIASDDADAPPAAPTLNDTVDRPEPATRMSSSEISAWLATFEAVDTKGELRAVLKDAFAKAHEYGDSNAHQLLKNAAAERSRVLPA